MKITTSAPRLKSWLLLASLLVTISAARLAQSQTSVGNIEVCYFHSNCFFEGSQDGPIFLIHNTSATAITNGVLKIGPTGGFTDAFNVGTIAAGTTFGVAVGISDDGGTGHTFFEVLCGGDFCIRDTSEVGPNGDDTQFEFTGRQGSKVVDSGVFTPAATKGLSLDGHATVNFLGGPGNADGPCNDCFFKKVADLGIPSSFSIAVTHTLAQGTTTFDYASNLQTTVDYSASGTNPSGFEMQSTIKWITDSGWGNQFDQLNFGTPFQGTLCLHQQLPSGVFACLVTIDVCRPVGSTGSFSGAQCPSAVITGAINLTQHFLTDAPKPVNKPGYLAGTDNALTCTPKPGCETDVNLGPGPGLQNILTGIVDGPVTINGTVHKFNSLFVPNYNNH